MCEKVDYVDLDKLTLESEMALRRLERMVEFLRVLYQKEVAIRNEETLVEKTKIVHPVDD